MAAPPATPPVRERRPRPPLDARALDELALGYVARFATSTGRLADYLRRKLRERGWDGEREPQVAEVVARLVQAGYVDDAQFARARADGLLRRGYGARRIDQALAGAGIDEDERRAARAGQPEARAAALTMARKRRLGPFGAEPIDRARREKQVAALLRAGHPLDSARRLVDAASVEEAERWADAADED